jgi:hypothetical protein
MMPSALFVIGAFALQPRDEGGRWMKRLVCLLALGDAAVVGVQLGEDAYILDGLDDERSAPARERARTGPGRLRAHLVGPDSIAASGTHALRHSCELRFQALQWYYRRSMRALTATLLAALPIACTALIDTGGLAGPMPADDGGHVADGSVIAPSSDASRDAASGARSSPCTAPLLLCDNFDDGRASPLGTWDRALESSGTLSLGPESLSPPHALSAALDQASGRRALGLGKTVSTEGGLVIELDYRIDLGGTVLKEIDPIVVNLIPLPPDRTESVISLSHYGTGPRFEHFYMDTSPHLSGVDVTADLGKWVHVVMTLSFGSSIEATLSVNDAPPQAISFPHPPVTNVDVQVGAPITWDSKAGQTALVDNVILRRP